MLSAKSALTILPATCVKKNWSQFNLSSSLPDHDPHLIYQKILQSQLSKYIQNLTMAPHYHPFLNHHHLTSELLQQFPNWSPCFHACYFCSCSLSYSLFPTQLPAFRCKSDHVMFLLKTLQWLSIALRESQVFQKSRTLHDLAR